VLLATVVDIDIDSKRVHLADGAILPYDSLIVAAGSETSYFGHNEWQEWAPGLKRIDHNPAQDSVCVRSCRAHPGSGTAPRLADVRHRGVEVKCDQMVQQVHTDGLTIKSGERTDSVAAKTVIWAGGIAASPLGKLLATRTKAETDKRGRIKVQPDLSIPNYSDIYVVGDLASAADEHGKPLPGLAQVAMQVTTMSPTNIFAPVSTPAQSILGLSVFVLWTIVAIVVVFSLLAYAAVRFWNKRGDDSSEPAQIYGSTQVELRGQYSLFSL
jgi:NADH dehydrogenase FAD-containing subunit